MQSPFIHLTYGGLREHSTSTELSWGAVRKKRSLRSRHHVAGQLRSGAHSVRLQLDLAFSHYSLNYYLLLEIHTETEQSGWLAWHLRPFLPLCSSVLLFQGLFLLGCLPPDFP